MILIRVRDRCTYVIQLHCPVFSCSYPEDPYDRFWSFQGTNSTMLQSTAPLQYLTGANGSVLLANGLYGQPRERRLKMPWAPAVLWRSRYQQSCHCKIRAATLCALNFILRNWVPLPIPEDSSSKHPFTQTHPPTHLTITAAMWRMQNEFTLRPTSRHQ
jgi:hypothetical protein